MYLQPLLKIGDSIVLFFRILSRLLYLPFKIKVSIIVKAKYS